MKIPFFISHERRLIAEDFEAFQSRKPMQNSEIENSKENLLKRTEESFRQGRESFQNGRYREADVFLTRAIEAWYVDARHFYLRAIVRHLLKDSQGDPFMDVFEGARLEIREKPDVFAEIFGKSFENIQGSHRNWLEKQRLLAKASLKKEKELNSTEVIAREPSFSLEDLERERQAILGDPNEMDALRECLKRKEQSYDILKLLKNDHGLCFNLRYVKGSTIQRYFQSHPDEVIRTTVGSRMHNPRVLTNWRMNIARTLFLGGYKGREEVSDAVVERACETICKSRERFGQIVLFDERGYVLYVAADEKFTASPAFKRLSPEEQEKHKLAAGGEYGFGIKPIQEMIKVHVKQNFNLIRVSKETSHNEKEKIFHTIRTQKKHLRLILHGHADPEYFYPSSGGGAFSVDELVDVFVARYEMREKFGYSPHNYFPIGLALEERGQKVVTNGLWAIDVFEDVLKIFNRQRKTTISDIVSYDEKENAQYNLFMTVPDISQNVIDSDMIIFVQCEGSDFLSNFYRRLRRKMGKKMDGQSYIPIVRRDKIQRNRNSAVG